MRKYLHLFENLADFNAAYNGSDYNEPWVSYTKQADKWIMDDGGSDVKSYYVGNFTVNGGGAGMVNGYIWKNPDYFLFTYMENPTTNDDTWTAWYNSSTGEYTAGVDNDEDYRWGIMAVDEGKPRVDYNKKTKYIRIEWTYSDEDYTTVETNLTCEDLEQTGNTYKAYLTEEYEEQGTVESEGDVVFDYYDEYSGYGNVWKLMKDGEPHGSCFVICSNGEVVAHMMV